MNTNTTIHPYILTLDDDDEFNLILKKELKIFGFEVVTTNNVKDYLNHFSNRRPLLAISDLHLGSRWDEGLNLLRVMRQSFGPDPIILILSRNEDSKIISNALELGATDYLAKPIDSYIFQNKINLYLKTQKNVTTFAKVPENIADCVFTFNITLKRVSEFGLTLNTPVFCSKNTILKLNAPIIRDIVGIETPTMTVSTVQVIGDGTFDLFLEFDLENKDQLSNVRSWILRKIDKQTEVRRGE